MIDTIPVKKLCLILIGTMFFNMTSANTNFEKKKFDFENRYNIPGKAQYHLFSLSGNNGKDTIKRTNKRGGPVGFSSGEYSVTADSSFAYPVLGMFAFGVFSFGSGHLAQAIRTLVQARNEYVSVVNEDAEDPNRDLEMQPLPPPERHDELRRTIYEWPDIPRDTCAIGVNKLDESLAALPDYAADDIAYQIMDQIEGNQLGLASYVAHSLPGLGNGYRGSEALRIVWTCTLDEVDTSGNG